MHNIQELLNKIKEKFPNINIIGIRESGSQLFKENPSDLDFTVLCTNEDLSFEKLVYTDEEGQKFDIRIRSYEDYEDLLDFDVFLGDFLNTVRLYNYEVAAAIKVVYGKWDVSWDMLANKERYLQFLKEEYQKSLEFSRNRYLLTKLVAYYFIPLKMMELGIADFTEEIKSDLELLFGRKGDYKALVDWVHDSLKKE